MRSFSMRNKIGFAAFVLLIVAAGSYGLSYLKVAGITPIPATLRIGAPLFFLWLAWPELEMFPRWVLQATIPVSIVVAIYPSALCFIVPTVLLMLYLQPKKTKKTKKK